MSETQYEYYEVEYLSNDTGEWTTCSNPKEHVVDAFITLGHHVENDPDMPHRIRRFSSEIVVAVPAKEDAK